MAMIDRVSHRLKLRDLRLLQAVVQWKSMAKAATHLNLTQPAVSKAIGELEHTLGVKLLDRNREGIEPTAHGLVLLKRGVVMFDELRQGISEIEYLSVPTAGAVRLAAAVTIAAGILPIITDRMSRQYPRISLHAKEVPVGALQFHARPYPDLRERAVDLVLAPIVGDDTAADLDVEPLFEIRFSSQRVARTVGSAVAARRFKTSSTNRGACHRRIQLLVIVALRRFVWGDWIFRPRR
jgi:DNA-binding transcriptional LysR family regulator